MQRSIVVLLLLMAGCELFPVAVDPNGIPQPERPPVLEFSYVNSYTIQGYIRFRNHCVGIKKYMWYLGIYDEFGQEITTNGSAPKVKYPRNGTYRVIVEGFDAKGRRYEQTLQVEVTTY
ncbi:MAG: PKD domain-containing protein [Cyclobacteriaceae bacterium]